MLIACNRQFIPNECRESWTKQFCDVLFPKYWYEVFKIANNLEKNSCVLEVGCGQGDVTSIFCYLGFNNVISFERDIKMYKVAVNKLDALFNRTDIILLDTFPNARTYESDVLVLVNCVYTDSTTTKKDYIDYLKEIYKKAGCPRTVILEVIDLEYDIEDDNFPYHVRLNESEVKSMFPNSIMRSIENYKYPINKKTKRLYIITEIQ